jgi:cell division protein FtsQ
MWNRPQLMKDIADLLFMAGAATLLVALAIGVTRLPHFPVREVVVTHELREVRRAEIERALSGMLRGNFFGIGLEAIRQSLERLPWVRRAGVRRVWPARIELTIEEHVPVAFLGQSTGRLLNSHSEIFVAEITVPLPEPLPTLIGPAAFLPEMLDCFRQAVALLKPHGRAPRMLYASPRLALQITLDNGMLIELGRQQEKAPVAERLRRFAEFYPSILTVAGKQPEVVDMRYPMGFVLRVATAREDEGERKP